MNQFQNPFINNMNYMGNNNQNVETTKEGKTC